MAVTGDFAKLQKMLAEINRIGDKRFIRLASKNAAEAMVTLVQLGFREERSPDGKAWAARKRKRARNADAGKLLRDTGRLANSITGRSSANSAVVGTNVKYAPFHQFGTDGHKKDFTRFQATDTAGTFISREEAGKKTLKAGGRTRTIASVSVVALNFKAGNGKIPARPFLPQGSLPAEYVDEIIDSVETAMAEVAPGLFGAVG